MPDVVKPHADLLAGGEQEGADVDVGLELIAPKQLDSDVDELLGRVRQVEAHDIR